jgi:hypothetical protein
MIVGFCGVLLFFFLPESFWDRTPRPRSRKSSKNSKNVSRVSLFSSRKHSQAVPNKEAPRQVEENTDDGVSRKPTIKNPPTLSLPQQLSPGPTSAQHSIRSLHVEFAGDNAETKDVEEPKEEGLLNAPEQVHFAGTESG